MNAFRKAFEALIKSPYGPAGMGLYSDTDNSRRKMNRSSLSATKPTVSQQASQQAKLDQSKSRKNPVKVYSQAEISRLFRSRLPKLPKTA